jgi:hypothetical protein
LLIAALALGVMLLQLSGILPNRTASLSSTDTPSPTWTQSALPGSDGPVDITSSFPTEEPYSEFETPADRWANAVLDYSLPLLSQNGTPVGGVAWWYTTVDGGILSWEGGQVKIDQHTLEVADNQSIEIAISSPANSGSLQSIGAARVFDTALQLSLDIPGQTQESSQWLLSGASPVLAMEALAIQASARHASLTVAYDSAGSTMQIVLLKATIEVAVVDQTQMAVHTASSMPPTRVTTSTPTRAPEAFLGQVVANRIDPGIDEVEVISPALTQRFIARHPWAGILASSEAGVTINGRTTSIAQATNFTIYLLKDDSGNVTRLFAVEYTQDSTTHFPDDQLLFQGHRMEEIVYWMVVRAAERGGQLIVAYDNFGVDQAITLIGFRIFSASAP